MAFLDIHLENYRDLRELERIADEKTFCAISLVPEFLRRGKYKSARDLLGKAFANSAILGQQGNTHECAYAHHFVDKWHEMACPYYKEFGLDRQLEVMQKGKETLKREFGVVPRLFVPPNHLMDMDTLDAAEKEGYYFFAVKGVLIKSPFKIPGRRIIVLPEVKVGKDGSVIYIHYDEIESNREEFEKIAGQARDFESIRPIVNGLDGLVLNDLAVQYAKVLRDILNLPRRMI